MQITNVPCGQDAVGGAQMIEDVEDRQSDCIPSQWIGDGLDKRIPHCDKNSSFELFQKAKIMDTEVDIDFISCDVTCG